MLPFTLVAVGVFLMLVATLLFAIMSVLVKKLGHIPPVELVFFRFMIAFIISFTTLKIKKIPPLGNNRKMLLVRGSCGVISVVLYFVVLQQIPLASATTLQFTAPIFTIIIASVAFKEKIEFWQYLLFLLSFIGIYLIKGFDERIEWIHVIMGLTASLTSGLAMNSIRKLSRTDHPLVIVFYFPLIATPIAAIASTLYWVTPHLEDWLPLLGIGVISHIAQYMMTKAYQLEETSLVASISYTGIIFAILFGWIWFDEFFCWEVSLGIGLVLIGVLLNLLIKKSSHSARLTSRVKA